MHTYFLYDFLHPDTTTINEIVLSFFFSLALYVLHKPCFAEWRVIQNLFRDENVQTAFCPCPGESEMFLAYYKECSLARSICIQLTR